MFLLMFSSLASRVQLRRAVTVFWHGLPTQCCLSKPLPCPR